ncbi:MAG: tRNA (adenosine(37)-N6)-threonylcarbamoyltransferase complex dimerization subunit type 1 TsaB [Planctomycetes bacterium]|jgi:tRNA threonylcarbamoyladenosine biosynthesis protein TsaB|nr:tRNA (adenosine(37)-N6)-threonylcarbamoyltransferase complex dimerization subunit type 1 TsaB [Planctomycetota bacterium]
MGLVILAIESSGDSGGAALVRDGSLLSEVTVPGARSHGAQLMPCVDRALARAKLARNQIDVVAVNCGPGSYTGLRIGLATAQGIAHGLDRPAVGVPCFEAMVLQYLAQVAVPFKDGQEFWPVLDARRDEVMTARFVLAGGLARRESGDRLLEPEKLCEQAAPRAVVFGTGLAAYPGRWDQSRVTAIGAELALTPMFLGLAAWHQLTGVKSWQEIPRAPVVPRYFRQVTAKTIAERAGDPDSRDVTERARERQA